MRLIRAGTLLVPVICIPILISGCAKRTPPAQQEQEEPKKIVITEAQTEPKTERPTEKQTEKKIIPSDIQVMVPKAARSGRAQYQITTGEGEKAGEFTFASTSESFLGTVSEEKGFYTGNDGTLVNAGAGWVDTDDSFIDLWNAFYSAPYNENIEIGGDVCCKYTIETEDPAGQVNGVAGMEGYTDVLNGETTINFYVSTTTNDLIRVDGKTTFMGDRDGVSEQGQIAVVYVPDSTEQVTIKKPEAAKPKETEDTGDEYEPGSILEGQNTYRNGTFNIQVTGNDLIYFDPIKTSDLEYEYRDAESPYTEEAYGQNTGVILNIISAKKTEATASACLAKFLSDSNAMDVQASASINIAGTEFITSTANINNTKTKNYCTEADGRVLIMTLYYQSDETVAAFESSLFSAQDDPFWHEDSWVLEGVYSVKTPKGYSINNGSSNDLYVTMKSDADEFTVFSVAESDIQREIDEELEQSGTTTKELVNEEQVPLADGGTLTYAVVKYEEPNLKYYVYIGLIQKDENVLKAYLVSTRDDMDYKPLFTEIANGISSQTDETETAPEMETALPEDAGQAVE